MMMKFTEHDKMLVGQEYFKRKIFRQIAEWINQWLNKHPQEKVNEMILKNHFIIDELEDSVLDVIPQEEIIKYISEIEMYLSSFTEHDKKILTKMIYFQLPDYREALNKNNIWIENYVKQALIAFDSFIYKKKQELKQNEANL